MPITQSAKKALRSSKKKRIFNLKRKGQMKNLIKEYNKFIQVGKIDEAKKMIPIVQKAIDKAAKKGVIKSNNADRKKSRIVKKLVSKEKANK